jgi:RNA polymerase sigma factor (sigma-70 family)
MLRSVFPKVYHAATTYGIDDDEMESAMFYRVCRAAAKFDTTRGTKFCTYANWCAKNAVLEEITSRTLKRNTPVDGKAVFSYDAGEMEGEQIVDQMEDARDRGTADGEEERLKPIKQEVGAMIEQLPPRLRQIVCMRFGIGQEKVTLRTIGMALGVSCERARQLEADAMRRMREGLKSSLIEKDRDQ